MSSELGTFDPSRRRTFRVGESISAQITPVHSVIHCQRVECVKVWLGSVSLPKPTKIRYVDQAMPPADEVV